MAGKRHTMRADACANSLKAEAIAGALTKAAHIQTMAEYIGHKMVELFGGRAVVDVDLDSEFVLVRIKSVGIAKRDLREAV